MRKRLRWSQEALADKAALSVSSVRQFERGKASECSCVPGNIWDAFVRVGAVPAQYDYREATVTPLQCRVARLTLGWSQKRLAEEAGISQPLVSRYERGGYQPQGDGLQRMRDALHAALEKA